MTTLELLLAGLSHALAWENLLAVLVGVLVGLFIGALPGLGPSAGVAILLPLVVVFPPTVSLAALAGVYYGSMYGGAVTSILLGIPGDPASVMTVMDGYPMAQKGEAGRALGLSVLASFVGGFIGIVLMTVLAQQVARWALGFGPAEMTALMVMALSLVGALGGDNPIKGLISLALGLWVGLIGLDLFTGQPRYTFGSAELLDGIDFTVVAVGIFGIAQILAALDEEDPRPAQGLTRIRFYLVPLRDIIRMRREFLLASLIGFVVGVLPGAGATVATMIAYAVAKRLSKHPERFGQGIPEGIVAPEAANNAAAFGAMVPLFTLGVPGSATTAVMLGGLMMAGLRPGPLLFRDHADFVWTVIGTFYIGNLILVVITLLLVSVLMKVVYVPKTILFPVVLGVVALGVYGTNYSLFEVWMALLFGVLGFVMAKLDYPAAPAILGVVLGPLLERNIRRALTLSGGSFSIFIERPFALVLLVITALGIVVPLILTMLRQRAKAEPARP